MLTAYEGTEPYIFISYSHKDSDRVSVILEELNRAGYRVWHDDGIMPGEKWTNTIAEHLRHCAVYMVFLARESAKSAHVKDEIAYALHEKKPILPVYLEDVKLSAGLNMMLSVYQSFRYRETDGFINRLLEAPLLAPCRAAPEAASLPGKNTGWNLSGGIQWTLNKDGVLTIAKKDSSGGKMPDYDFNLIRSPGNAPWMKKRREIVSVLLENGVFNIGGMAFAHCTALRSVSVPDSVTSIGASAFYDCASLTEIVIPDSVQYIGKNAFRACFNLRSVYIPDSVTSIGESAFHDCASLISITLPESVTSVGASAFRNCTSLKQVTLPAHTWVGASAFPVSATVIHG